MSVAAYYLTLIVGVAAMALVVYGSIINLRSKAFSYVEWRWAVAIAVFGVALSVTAIKAIAS